MRQRRETSGEDEVRCSRESSKDGSRDESECLIVGFARSNPVILSQESADGMSPRRSKWCRSMNVAVSSVCCCCCWLLMREFSPLSAALL
jgi:hypothetical protein